MNNSNNKNMNSFKTKAETAAKRKIENIFKRKR
jgi:hypothetical protein